MTAAAPSPSKSAVRLPGVPVSVCAAMVVLAAAMFAVGEMRLLRINSWWADELFTVWATAPDQGVLSVWQRIAPDPTAPLYYLALYLLRRVIDPPIQGLRLETFGLNVGFMMAAALVVVVTSRRAGITRLGLLGIVAFLLSGCAFSFAQEARAYCLALCAVFVTAWGVAMIVTQADAGWSWRRFAALGFISAFIHAFAALACGALAAGVVATGLAERRGDLLRPGLALGLAAVLGCVARVLIAGHTHELFTLAWIRFTQHDVYVAANHVSQIEVGGWPARALVALLAGSALLHRQTHRLACCFLVALAMFFLLPLIMSLVLPMFVDRYLLIGGPLLLVFITFLAGSAWRAAHATMPLVIGGGALAFLCLSGLSGFVAAYDLTQSKPGWVGADTVRPLAGGCPPRSIHVSGRTGNAAALEAYALLLPLPVDRFVDATLATTAWLPAAPAACPVLGWAEQVFKPDEPGYLAAASDEELLAALKIRAEPGQVDIKRHGFGYVVLSRP
jgi:hypothetical protein